LIVPGCVLFAEQAIDIVIGSLGGSTCSRGMTGLRAQHRSVSGLRHPANMMRLEITCASALRDAYTSVRTVGSFDLAGRSRLPYDRRYPRGARGWPKKSDSALR
jgi:hypothetical protein